MPQPTLSDVHVNVPLTNISVAFLQRPEAFVADRVFPIIPVSKISDRYYVYNRGDFNRNDMKKRAPGAESAGTGYNLDNTPSYLADVWSLHKDIPDQVRGNSDAVLEPDLEATMFLANKALINREIQFTTNYFNTSIWTTNYTGVASSPGANQLLQWNDPSSTPIEDVRRIKRIVMLASGGFPANVLTLSKPVYDVLCDHPDFVDRIKYGQTEPRPAQVTKAIMAQLFEVEEVLVMEGVFNTLPENEIPTGTAGSDSNSFIGGTNAMLTYRPPQPGLMTASAGYTFAWTGLFGNTAVGTRIKSFYLPWLESTRVEIDSAYAQKVVSPDCGAFISSAVSATA